jgi:hypothetical protein
MTSKSKSRYCLEVVGRYCPAAGREWLDEVYSRLGASFDANLFATAYSGARRRLGHERETGEILNFENGALSVLHCSPVEEIGRAVLLLRATEALPEEEHSHFVHDIYQRGDTYERKALLRALSILPDPGRFLSTAVEACRSHISTVFEAIACENPYPLHYFPALHFNQMVLKLLFTSTALSRVAGLQSRITPDLVRKVEDYASERRAAERPLPGDITLITKITNDREQDMQS